MENKYFIEGERIYLREIKPEDVNENYLSWMNDKEVTQFLESRFSTQTLESIQNYVRETSDQKKSILLAVVDKEQDKHIGNIRISNIDLIHKNGGVGVMIGERSYWGKGYGSEAIKLLVDYAFNKLGLHRLTAYIYSENIGSIKAFKKAGFVEEGTTRDMRLYNGKYIDEKILGIVNDKQ